MTRNSEFTRKVDKIVGMRIHEMRISLGWSRAHLAKKVGVSHQQIQKYENGTNRITLGRLILIAKALNQAIGYFFDKLDIVPRVVGPHEKWALESSKEFSKIQDVKKQSAILALIKTMS